MQYRGAAAFEQAARQPGNPLDAAVGRLDGALALKLAGAPELWWYNRLSGLSDVRQFKAALTFYGALPFAIETWPMFETPELLSVLAEKGFAPFARSATLYGQPSAPPHGGIETREVSQDEQLFDRVYLRAFGFDDPAQQAMTSLENGVPGARRYLAFLNGEAVAAAALIEHEGVAYLAGAATLPEFRRSGAQSALVARRVADAGSGALVAVTATLGSGSQRNLERLGLRVAHVKTTWRQEGPAYDAT